MTQPLKFGDVEWCARDALDEEQQREALKLWRVVPSPRRAAAHYSFAVARTGRAVVMIGRYEGPEDAPEVELCSVCDGEGSFECEDCDGKGEATQECEFGYEHDVDCDECGAAGVIDCDLCSGTGSEEE